MELLVCIKQVPDDSVSVSLGADGAPKLDEIAPVVNAFDTYALEMAARFKEAHGYKLAEESVCDTQGIAYLLSKASAKAGEQPFDVIFCGSESTDASSGQVGAQLAEILGIPVVTNVLAVEPREGGVTLKQETEEGYRVVEAPCPCVVTIVKPNYEPRYPSIKSKMAARKMPIGDLTAAGVEADAAQFGPEAAKVRRVAISAPPQRQSGVKIQEKEAAEAVRRAMEMLAGQKLI